MKRASFTIILAAAILALTAMGTNARAENPKAGPVDPSVMGRDPSARPGAGSTPYTLGELTAALALDDAQQKQMSDALDTWRETRDERPRGAFGNGPRGRDDRPGRGRRDGTGWRHDGPGTRRGGMGGQGIGSGGPQGAGFPCLAGEPASVTFLAATSGFLSDDQFVRLAGLLQAHREARMDARSARFDERPRGQGRGDRGGDGFARGEGHGWARGWARDDGDRGPGKRGGDWGRGGGRGEGALGDLIRDEDLSRSEVRALHDAFMESHKAMRAIGEEAHAGTLEGNALRDRSKDVRESLAKSLDKALDKDGMKKVTALMDEHRQRWAECGLTRLEEGREKRVETMTRLLALDKEQTSRFAGILEKQESQTRSLLEKVRDGKIRYEEAVYQGDREQREAASSVEALLGTGQRERMDAVRSFLSPPPRVPLYL